MSWKATSSGSLAGAFAAHRKTRGLSQEEFADVAGVHRTFIGGLERGERNVTLQTVERLADRLHVDPMDLLSGSDGG